MMRTMIAIVAVLVLFAAVVPAQAQQKMKYEDYLVELEKWQQREAAAQERIAGLEEEIAALESDIAALEEEEAETWQSIYDMLDTSRDQVDTFHAKLDDLEARIQKAAAMSPAELYENMELLDELEAELASLEARPEALLTSSVKKLDRMRSTLAAARSKGESYEPPSKTHTVIRGDYLWKISGMSKYYGDPMKWMRIYSFNVDQIKDPNLIFPNQRLTIPMAVDRKHYIVAKGDFLYSIAKSVYGDPFQWRKLYDSNMQALYSEDPNLIYPETIIKLPGR
ncbi:LysM peptidoglycan-binding domain-containing protein [bacterium]|nr:LysM peptidoglycan-binding domain-containing protein [bacterium]